MPANVLFPEDWDSILAALRANDDQAAKGFLIERERRLDGYFSIIDKNFYAPIVTQLGNVTYATPLIDGFRIGPWVQLNVKLNITGAGTGANIVTVSLPPTLLPYTPVGETFSIGSMHIQDTSAGIHYYGACTRSSAVAAGLVTGIASQATAFFGQAASVFAAGLASTDVLDFSIQYMTIAPTT